VAALSLQVVAQIVHPTAVSFGGECSGNRNSFSKPLDRLIQEKRIGNSYESCASNSDMCVNSFAFDLNGDKRQEYFVRLGCGATGNCTYGIFTDRPARLHGTFTAWFFWIDNPGSSWRKITAYEREGGNQGYIQSLVYRRGAYRRTAGRRESFDSSKKSFAEKMGMPDCTSN
jgi:hypothetical protein